MVNLPPSRTNVIMNLEGILEKGHKLLQFIASEGGFRAILLAAGISIIGTSIYVLLLKKPNPKIEMFSFAFVGLGMLLMSAALFLYFKNNDVIKAIKSNLQDNHSDKTDDYPNAALYTHDIIANNECRVFHGPTRSVTTYSKFTRDFLKEKRPPRIFSVCAFEPIEILQLVLPKFQDNPVNGSKNGEDNSIPSLKNISPDDFEEGAYECLPHFREFRNYHENNIGIVERILILRDRHWQDRNEDWMFERFGILNGDIPCWVADRSKLEDWKIAFITDFVLFGEDMLVDFYSDSNSFYITSPCRTPELRERLLGLYQHFMENRQDTSHFVPLSAYLPQEK